MIHWNHIKSLIELNRKEQKSIMWYVIENSSEMNLSTFPGKETLSSPLTECALVLSKIRRKHRSNKRSKRKTEQRRIGNSRKH